jgi:hypothetical protein
VLGPGHHDIGQLLFRLDLVHRVLDLVPDFVRRDYTGSEPPVS